MKAQPPSPGVDGVFAYPLEFVPCPECTTPRHRLPGPGSDLTRIGRCPRCNNAKQVLRPIMTHPET